MFGDAGCPSDRDVGFSGFNDSVPLGPFVRLDSCSLVSSWLFEIRGVTRAAYPRCAVLLFVAGCGVHAMYMYVLYIQAA